MVRSRGGSQRRRFLEGRFAEAEEGESFGGIGDSFFVFFEEIRFERSFRDLVEIDHNVLGFRLFLVHAGEVRRSDLQGIEEEASSFGVGLFLHEQLHDLADDDLDGVRILEEGYEKLWLRGRFAIDTGFVWVADGSRGGSNNVSGYEERANRIARRWCEGAGIVLLGLVP